MRAIDKMDIVSLLDFSWQRGGLVKGEKIINTLRELVGDQNIEDLPIRYTAVATDIDAEKEVWIQSGSLFDAMRASMSLPLFFTPFEIDSRKLIDGGVLNPVPIAPTFSDHTTLKVAVNLGGRVVAQVRPSDDRSPPSAENTACAEHDEERSGLRARINRFVNGLQESLSQNDDREEWGAYDIASQAFDAMQEAISRQKLAAYPPDKVMTIPRNACGPMDFDRAADMIALGYKTAREQLADG